MRRVRLDDPAGAAGGAGLQRGSYRSDGEGDAAPAFPRLRHPQDDQVYGDHSSQLEDPFGHLWWVATHKEDVAPDEMQERTSDVREERSF